MSFWSSLWNGVKSVFGSVGGSAVSSAMGVISNKTQMKYQKDLMKDQYNYNVKLADKNLQQSKALQQFQNDYTTKMANSAHQIEVNDLRKAGLNPILSATGGNGADFSTGGATISSGTASGAQAPNVDYLNSAIAFRQQKNNNKLADSQEWLQRKQASLVGEQARNEAERYDSIVQDRMNSIATTASVIERNKKEGDAALINAYANKESSSAGAYRNRQEGYYAGARDWKSYPIWMGDVFRRTFKGKKNFWK